MDGKQLRNSILQWAIQGKLVPQDPNDEPASVLLERIREEKARLVKEKKIKRDKNESIIYRGDDNSYYEKLLATGEVKCIDDEIPFDLPNSWLWCRFNVVVEVATNLVDSSKYGDMPHVAPDNIEKGTGVLLSYRTVKEDDVKSANHYFFKGQLVYSKIRPLLRKVIIAPFSGLCSADMYPLNCKILPAFALVLMLSDCFNSQVFAKSGTRVKMPKVNKDELNSVLLPIPPYNEQQRIVNKLEEILPLLKRYSNTKEQFDKLNDNIYLLLKKSILQEAISGKLVEQDPNEKPAIDLLKRVRAEKEQLVIEGKLKKSALQDSIIFKGDDNKYYENLNGEVTEITDQIPFDIPTSWQWVRLETVCSYIQRGKSPKYSSIKRFPVVAQKCNQWSGFSLEKALFIAPETVQSYQEERILQNGDLLWNSTGLGTLGRMAIYRSDLNPYGWAVADSHVTVIRPMSQIISDYLFSYFASPTVQSVIEDKADGSTKQKELATSTIKGYYVPLPPAKEQMRIVQQIRTLFQSLN